MPLTGEDKVARLGIGEFRKDRHRPSRKRNLMSSPGFHASGRNGPNFRVEVDFIPACAKHFARARRRQDREFERQRRRCFPLAQFADEPGTSA